MQYSTSPLIKIPILTQHAPAIAVRIRMLHTQAGISGIQFEAAEHGSPHALHDVAKHRARVVNLGR